jgi:hypothetical protein
MAANILNCRILDALPQAARGIDRFWKADSVGEAFPILRAVETSEVIPYIATRDSFLPQNYEKMEWLGAQMKKPPLINSSHLCPLPFCTHQAISALK